MSTYRRTPLSRARRVAVVRVLGSAIGAFAVTASMLAGQPVTSASDVTTDVDAEVTTGVTTEPVASARKMTEPFRVATFNILGAGHTVNGRKGFATYEPRMRRTIGLINRRGFDIVGLQEYQIPQHEMFTARAGQDWDVYPGLKLGRRPVQNSITWRSAEWRLVEGRSYEIPYFRGKLVEQPYVKLENRASGAQVWVINTHNPANSKGPAQRWRDRAVDIQAALANDLERTGVPVILTGDFNDRAPAFCRLTGQSSLQAANGGSHRNGSCTPPRGMRIDWIFMSPSVQTLYYKEMSNRNVARITDHKVIFADLSVPLS